MSERTIDLSNAEKAQISSNLGLARQFIRELVDAPEQHESLPANGTIILLPGDDFEDAELSKANMALAQLLAAQGQHIVTWVVGMPALSGPRILPRWPLVRGEHSEITYNRHQDTLMVVFAKVERPTMPVRIHPRITVLVDPETRMTVSFTIPAFLAEVAPKSLALFDLLLLPATTLIGMTRGEAQAVRNTFTLGEPRTDPEEMSVVEILDELSALGA